MGNAGRERVPELFGEALSLPLAERAAYLARACGGDEALRAEVERLLQAHDRAGGFIERSALAQLADQPTVSETREWAGERVGPYRVLRELGRGGMGVVYLAERADGEFHKQVAIKLLPASADENERQRFRRERQILADLEHPNIARLLDGGTLNGRPYVVMDFVPGQSLREMLRARGPLPLAEINPIVQQICAGLAEAHERGVIHRDIKPENLIVTERHGQPHATILDFGIAKLQRQTTTANTNAAAILGTVNYMSPEQAAGAGAATIDARSDLYSLGMVIYELLTGAPAFKSETYVSVLYQHQHAAPVPPDQARTDMAISPAVSEVVLRALAKSPDARQQSARQLAAEFERAVRNGETRFPRWKQASLRAAAGLAIALMAWAAWAIFPRHQPPAPAPSAVLEYRIFKKTGAETQTLPSRGAVQPGDEIQFEMKLPFPAHCYLFFEEHEGTLVWVNPIPNQPPQHLPAGEPVRVPENFWIPYGADKARKQLYIAVYVPDAAPWSLENIVPPSEMSRALKTNLEDVNIPYARFQASYADQIVKLLDEKALLAAFSESPVNGRYAAALPQTDGRRIIFHRIELWHRGK
jgi:predicted Ser/Thr protein kinase